MCHPLYGAQSFRTSPDPKDSRIIVDHHWGFLLMSFQERCVSQALNLTFLLFTECLQKDFESYSLAAVLPGYVSTVIN